MRDQPTMTDPPPRASAPRRKNSSSSSGDKEKDHHTNHKKMAAQSQGIKQLMASEKEAAQVVANARKSKDGSQVYKIDEKILNLMIRYLERIIGYMVGSLRLVREKSVIKFEQSIDD